MPAVPVSFFISLFLMIVLLRLIWARDEAFGALVKITLAVYALQSLLIGLNWGYGLTFGWPVQGAMATLIPPLTWLALCNMVTDVKGKLRPLYLVLYGAPSRLSRDKSACSAGDLRPRTGFRSCNGELHRKTAHPAGRAVS